MLNNIGSVELNVPSLLPIDCLLGGINFFHVLVIQTALPLILVTVLFFVGKAAGKAGDIARRKMDADGVDKGKQPLGHVLAELCSTVSFFLIFLLYPGSSNKIFNALMCSSFNGEGEDGQSFLRVDFSIDCNSLFYNGIMKPVRHRKRGSSGRTSTFADTAFVSSLPSRSAFFSDSTHLS